jgi:hypothetical protein
MHDTAPGAGDSFDELVEAAKGRVEHERREAADVERHTSEVRDHIGDLRSRTEAAKTRISAEAAAVAGALLAEGIDPPVKALTYEDHRAIVEGANKINPIFKTGTRGKVERRESKASKFRATETQRRSFATWEMGVNYRRITHGSGDLGSSESVRAYLLGKDGKIYAEERWRAPGVIGIVELEDFEVMASSVIPGVIVRATPDEQLVKRLEHLVSRQEAVREGLALLVVRNRLHLSL